MLDLKREVEAGNLARRTVEYYRLEQKHCALLYADLDNFGQVNKLISQQEGSRVIRELGAVLELVCSEEAILLHDGGDEFVALIPGGCGEDIVILAYEIWRAVKNHDFKTPQVDLGLSCGLATTEKDEEKSTFECLVQTANKALTEYAKKPKKGRARFVEGGASELSLRAEMRLTVAYCLLKSSLFRDSPFGNVWLNCLSRIIRKDLSSKGFSVDEHRRSAEDFLRWADLDPLTVSQSISAIAREDGLDANPHASPVDRAFACAHGLMCHALFERARERLISSSLVLRYGGESQGCALTLSDGSTLWSFEPAGDLSKEFRLGNFWQLGPDHAMRPDTSARAVLVQVGHEDIGVPSALFSERVVVDDRPTRGGGLPDFWEATIARLTAQVLKNPNVDAVYLLGAHKYAAQTVEKLKDLRAWSEREDLISYKTGMPVLSIRAAAKVLEGKVRFPSNCEELVMLLSEILRPPHIIQLLSHEPAQQRGHGFLKREMQIDHLSLGRKDGCRVKTVAEAYPVVLEIVRQAVDERPIRDQAGQELRELVDFKIHLSNPADSSVPEFYAAEKDSLEKYFQKEFLSETGLFGPRFRQFGQMGAVLAHLVRVVTDPNRQFATRRAILVIPHEIREGTDLAPLGLVSVRCMPRFLAPRIVLHFSYTWRTVEALVGLPYSLFGSVRFSKFFTDEVKRCVPPDFARQIDMGEVSYIAHSLHMFVDEYGQNIAKRIVDDASI
jgi:diguanylate cyclase (GGDEF)-like protein